MAEYNNNETDADLKPATYNIGLIHHEFLDSTVTENGKLVKRIKNKSHFVRWLIYHCREFKAFEKEKKDAEG